MRNVLMVIAVALALLGAFGFGAARPSVASQPATAHTRLLASSGATPLTEVCPGGGSTSCG